MAFDISENFNVKKAWTFDSRSMRQSYASLLEFTPADFIPAGFPVSVFDQDQNLRGVYQCINENPLEWEKISGNSASFRFDTWSAGSWDAGSIAVVNGNILARAKTNIANSTVAPVSNNSSWDIIFTGYSDAQALNAAKGNIGTGSDNFSAGDHDHNEATTLAKGFLGIQSVKKISNLPFAQTSKGFWVTPPVWSILPTGLNFTSGGTLNVNGTVRNLPTAVVTLTSIPTTGLRMAIIGGFIGGSWRVSILNLDLVSQMYDNDTYVVYGYYIHNRTTLTPLALVPVTSVKLPENVIALPNLKGELDLSSLTPFTPITANQFGSGKPAINLNTQAEVNAYLISGTVSAPVTPAAPTSPIKDDINNTFDFTLAQY